MKTDVFMTQCVDPLFKHVGFLSKGGLWNSTEGPPLSK